MTDEAHVPTEDELRAAYEAEIKQIRVEQILLENIVTMINMGMRRTGLMPGTEEERDPNQVIVAIEAVRAHMPLIEQIAPDQNQPIQEALSQLQMAFVQIGGGDGAQVPPAAPSAVQPAGRSAVPPAPPAPPAPPPSKLWIPGQ